RQTCAHRRQNVLICRTRTQDAPRRAGSIEDREIRYELVHDYGMGAILVAKLVDGECLVSSDPSRDGHNLEAKSVQSRRTGFAPLPPTRTGRRSRPLTSLDIEGDRWTPAGGAR